MSKVDNIPNVLFSNKIRDIQPEQKYICSVHGCVFMCTASHILLRHKRKVHLPKLECDMCSYSSSEPHNLKRHKKTKHIPCNSANNLDLPYTPENNLNLSCNPYTLENHLDLSCNPYEFCNPYTLFEHLDLSCNPYKYADCSHNPINYPETDYWWLDFY